MTATPSTFKDLLPEFASVADARIQTFLTFAGFRVDAKWFGDLTDYAVVFLAAHMLSTAGAGAAGASTPSGPVASESVGEISVSYGAPASGTVSAADSEYMTTKYGRQFLTLRAERVMPVIAPGLRRQM